MAPSTHYRRLIQALFFALFFYQCSAQLGTAITYPISNDTVTPGQKIDIQYHYQNMGNGSYTVDVDLWQDNGVSILAKNIATDVSVPSGTSAGTKLDFSLNATYTWTVPKGLNETVYLTVTTKPDLENKLAFTMRSRPIVLHINAGLMNMPIQKIGLLALSIGVLFFVGF